MAQIAVELEQALGRRHEHQAPGGTRARVIATGNGWSVADVVCTSGPTDPSFEEQHSCFTIAIVLAGSFQYESSLGGGLMTPGSLMLGNQGQCYECGHEHGHGDRCVSFWYAPDYFERVAADAGSRGSAVKFTAARVPPLATLSSLVANAALGVSGASPMAWEELGVSLAVRTLDVIQGVRSASRAPLNAEARVSRAVRTINKHPHAAIRLDDLAAEAGLSPYHFLRMFRRLTGVTPHQYVMRARLREAAIRLVTEPRNVLDIALDCGFGDVSNFNRAFRTEFGVTPVEYRRGARRPAAVVQPSGCLERS